MEGLELLRHVVRTAPLLPGVYEMCDANDTIMYVGKAKSLKKRLISYIRVAQLPVRLQRMVHALDHIRLTTTHTETEALLLEYNLIQKHRPPCNILLKDGQSFVTIALTHHRFPQLMRQRGRRPDADIFGPYPSSFSADETLRVIQRVFMLRTCSDSEFANRVRPCLKYDMKLCSGPCVQKISPDDYLSSVHQAKRFLKGESHIVQQEMAQKMEKASDDLHFEEAAKLRDRLAAIATVQTRQNIMVDAIDDSDVIVLLGDKVRVLLYRNHHLIGGHTHVLQNPDPSASQNMAAFIKLFYVQRDAPPVVLLNVLPDGAEDLKKWLGIKRFEQPKRGGRYDILRYALQGLQSYKQKSLEPKKVLARLAELVGLKKIERLEIYDNSHLQATNAGGMMIVVTAEKGVDKSQMRQYNLPSNIHDDGHLMQHTLTKRFEKTSIIPDLIILDGGMIQIRAAESVLGMLGLKIPLLGFVKHLSRKDGLERLIQPDGREISLDSRSEMFKILLQWRDEAHRGAIHRHRQKRSKQLIKSALDDIEGVGLKRKKALLQRFGSVRGVASAALHDLISVPGISQDLGKRIYGFFHQEK